MSISQADLDSFHSFASELVSEGNKNLTLEQVLARWRAAHQRAEVNAALREAIADLDAGRARPADEVMKDLRHKHNIPAE